MAKQVGEGKAVEPTEPSTPKNADQLIESGWRHYANKEYFKAEDDFKKALEDQPENMDTLYAIALSQYSAGRKEDSIQTFEKVIQSLEENESEDPVRATMLTRLSHGHINQIKSGDWDLTK